MKSILTSIIAAGALAGLAGAAGAAPLDLSGFTAYGTGSYNWNVAGDNNSVTQTINGDPTAFVSADSFINSSFEGSFVTSDTDDDYMGFVFGFGADDSSPFFLFDWKKGDQNGSYDGFTLSYVTGGFASIPFSNHQDDTTGYDVIATDVDTTSADPKGYLRNETYDFKLTYQTNRILIEVGGASPLGSGLQTIFDVNPSDVAGLSSFGAGRFGFYNHSQDNVTYRGFTEEDAPENPVVPVPASLPLLLSGLGGMGFLMRKRRKA